MLVMVMYQWLDWDYHLVHRQMVAFLVRKHFSSTAFMRLRLLESKAYLRNPDSAEAIAACQEALAWEGINIIM
jgi:hypothetical protein